MNTKEYGRISVLVGGFSSEREISLKSGRAVYGALKKKIQDVDFLDIGRDFGKQLETIDADLAFIALHGKIGEDGTIQALLEKMNIPYTGSGVEASRLALDKIASREIFLANGLKVPYYYVVEKNTDLAMILDEFKIPFVVKPQCEGSSIGLSIIQDRSQLKEALDKAFRFGNRIIVEEYIHGREITVGILEDAALPVIEIVAKSNVYDFVAKYEDEHTQYIVPAKIEKAAYREAQLSALKAHRLLKCRDFSRVDMRMDKNDNVYVLEVNTIPGMTERSLLPKAALVHGISFEDLCLRLVDLALRRESGDVKQKVKN